VEVSITTEDKNFRPAIDYLLSPAASAARRYDGWTFRCEAICRPKHNTLKYDRTPNGFLVLLNADAGLHNYVNTDEKSRGGMGLATEFGLEPVPVLGAGNMRHDDLVRLLDTESVLGGCKVEGVVVKPLFMDRFDPDTGKLKMAKLVSEGFKERHRAGYRKRNPTQGDVVLGLVDALSTEARFTKAVQHLRDDGSLTGDQSDIGALIKELHLDLEAEEADFIKDRLYSHFIKTIKRGVGRGLPSWYKEKLAKGEIDGSVC